MRSVIIVAYCLAAASSIYVRNPTLNAKHQLKESDARSQVVALRGKLSKISAGLVATLDPSGILSHSRVATSLQAFGDELKHTLAETENMQDSDLALKKLKDAQAGVKSLLKDMTVRQMELMNENNEQQQSLLLGVLMSRKNEAIEKQFEVLKSPEFAKLPVTAAIMKQNDRHTPLFQQVARFLDAHKKTQAPSKDAKSDVALVHDKSGKPDVAPIVQALEVRVAHIEKSELHRASLHQDEMTQFDTAIKKAVAKNNTKLAHRIERMKKREDRKYAKEEAISKRDHDSLTEAIEAIKKGDIKQLVKAQQALEQSMRAMQSRSNGFIVFIQKAHRVEGLDCPFCVAQCIEKCSSAGKSYTTCMTDCADAGSD